MLGSLEEHLKLFCKLEKYFQLNQFKIIKELIWTQQCSEGGYDQIDI